jgi:hypothetical protein
LSGVSASGVVGDVVKNIPPQDGVVATGQVGNVGLTTTVALSGVAASGDVGTVAGGHLVSGVEATGAVGNVGKSVTVALSGVSASGQVGTVSGSNAVALTGVSAVGETGSLTPEFVFSVALTGVQATGQTGSFGIEHTRAIIGNIINGEVGTAPPLWSLIDDSQDGNWQNVNTDLPGSWNVIGTVPLLVVASFASTPFASTPYSAGLTTVTETTSPDWQLIET